MNNTYKTILIILGTILGLAYIYYCSIPAFVFILILFVITADISYGKN